MLKTAIAAGTLAGVLLLAPMVRAPARAAPAPTALQAGDIESSAITEVRRRHFGHRKFHRGFRGRHFRFRRHYGGRIWVGRSCRWLRIRAIVTGSPYWWRRYYRCRYRWY